jgi:hypothetical protein
MKAITSARCSTVCYYSTLKTEAAVSSEMLMLVFQTTCHIAQDSNVYITAVRNESVLGYTSFVSWIGQSTRLCVSLLELLSSWAWVANLRKATSSFVMFL